jgi:hypothetical protein
MGVSYGAGDWCASTMMMMQNSDGQDGDTRVV